MGKSCELTGHTPANVGFGLYVYGNGSPDRNRTFGFILLVTIGDIMRYLLIILTFFLFIPCISQADTIIDNGDNGTSCVGSWSVSGASGFYGDDSLYSKTANTSYTYDANVTGLQQVSLWWTEWTSRGTEIPVQIYDGDTLLDTVMVDQSSHGEQWNVLGTYNFTETAKVVLISNGPHSTCADAVKFDSEILPTPVTITWDYDAVTDLAGFTLRVNDNETIDLPDPALRTYSFIASLSLGENKFDMQAYDNNGKHSVWSEPAFYTLVLELKPPENLKAIITP